MLKITLYAVLGLFAGAMLLFVAGFILAHIGLSLVTALLYAIAPKLLLLAFAVMLLVLVVLSMRALTVGLVHYFRREARAMRQLLRLQIRRRDDGQRQWLEKRQIHYRSLLQRQKLRVANDKKHSRQLLKAITSELQGQLPRNVYKQVRRQLKQLHKQANPQGMLALRDQVLCRF